jgi:hypothetical protein
LRTGEQRTKLTISNEWSNPVPVEYGKNILIRFSKEYFFVTIKITGDESTSFIRTIFGKAEQTIEAHNISHIRNPVISFLAEVNEKIEAELF